MNIHVGDMVYAVKIPMFVKVMGYLCGTLFTAILTTEIWNPYNWGWPDWFKWGVVMLIYFFVLKRAINNRNRK